MKTIAVLGLSTLAVNAFNPQDYIEGFGQQFGLDQTAVQDAFDCVTGLQNNAVEVIQLIQQNQNNLPGLLSQAPSIVENLQASLAAECQPIAEDLATVIYQNVGNQDLQEVVKMNLQRYFPQIIQKAAQWVHYLAAGDDNKAGQTDAYMYQVLLGIEQPETLPVPEITEFVPVDEKKYLIEYYTSFYKTLGIHVDAILISTCFENMESFALSLKTLIEQLPELDYVGTVEAIKNFVVEAAPAVEGCEGAFAVQKEIIFRLLRAAGDNKLGFILETIDNLALNMPEYVYLKQKEIVDLYSGDYILAGEDDAKAVQILDGGRIFN